MSAIDGTGVPSASSALLSANSDCLSDLKELENRL